LGIPNAAGSSCGPDENAGDCAKNQWIQGAINAMPYITIFLFAGWASDPLNHLFGRRVTIWIGAIFSLLAPIGMAVSQTWGQLLACR
jgi:MFS family permease